MKYRLDKNHFKKQTLWEADHREGYWLKKSVEDRLSAAWYLTCQVYNISYENPPPLDKTCFSKKLRKN